METIISSQELSRHLGASDWRVFDCRFSLANPTAGADLYATSHIPGAIYADIEHDLSGTLVPGTTGRHPLPDREEWLTRVREWGVSNATQVIAYDDAGGAFAARLWWMLRWLGHRDVAVLDGGWQNWVDSGFAVSDQMPNPRSTSSFQMHAALTRTIESEPLLEALAAESVLLLDARDGARYRGEVEPIDPVAGHIQGARSLPFAENLDDNGCFRSPEELTRRFLPVLARDSDQAIVCYCGSGVTAAHNILAMVHAGFEEPALYPGSWSEWITDPHRPIEQG